MHRIFLQLHFGEQEDLRYHAVDVLGLGLDGSQIAALHLGRARYTVEQALHIRLDRGQRGAQVVRDARHQLFPAFLLPERLLDRPAQPLYHLVKVRTDRGEFILPVICDAEIQIPVADLVHAVRQQRERLFDAAEYKTGQKPVGEQNGCQCCRQHKQHCGRGHEFEPRVGYLLCVAEDQDAVIRAADLHAMRIQAARAVRKACLLPEQRSRFRERVVRRGGGAVSIIRLSILLDFKRNSFAVEQGGDAVQRFLLIRILQGLLGQFRNAGADLIEVLAVVKAQPAAEPDRIPHRAHTARRDQRRDADRHKDHQQIGDKQPLADRHSSHRLSFPYHSTKQAARL